MTTSGSASNKVTVNDGNITGCWASGIGFGFDASVNTNFNVDGIVIDLVDHGGTNCSGHEGGYGVNAPGCVVKINSFANSVVRNAANSCIDFGDGTISYSIVHGCATGIEASSNCAGQNTTVSHVLSIDNGVNLWKNSSVTPTFDTSTVRNASTCNFKHTSTCDSSGTSTVTFSGTDFVDDVISVN